MTGLCLQETTVAQKTVNLGVATAEAAVHLVAGQDTAGGEHLGEEAFCHLLVEDVASLLKASKASASSTSAQM